MNITETLIDDRYNTYVLRTVVILEKWFPHTEIYYVENWKNASEKSLSPNLCTEVWGFKRLVSGQMCTYMIGLQYVPI